MKKNISSRLTKIIEWLIYVSVVLVPIIFLPQVNSVFAAPKLYVFRVITLLIILLWGVKCVFDEKMQVRFSKFFWFVIGYALISIVNTFLTVNVFTSLFGTYGRFLGIFTVINLLFWIYIVFTFINSREKIINLMWVSVGTAFFVAVYGLLQYFDLFVNFIPWTMDPMDRVFSTIGHSNHTAAYLGMNMMLLLALLLNESKRKWKIILLLGLALLALVLILTASRGGVLAVIITGIMWLVFVLKSKKLSKKTFKFTIVGLLIAAVLGIILSGPISKLGVVERTTSTVTFVLQGNMPDRVSWWLSSLEMIGDAPVFGHGLSSFKNIYNKYRRTDYRVPDDLQDNITPETAHNEYLNIAATQGILGFLVYAFMIVYLLFITFKQISDQSNKDRIMIFGIFSCLSVYLISVFISFGTISTLFIFYTFIGVLISLLKLQNKEIIIEFKKSLLISSTILFFSIIIFINGFIFSYKLVIAEYHFKQAKLYSATGDLEAVLDNYKAAELLHPENTDYYIAHANYIFEFAVNLPAESQETYLHDSVKNYANAIKNNRNIPSAAMNLGLVYSRLADLNRNDEYLYSKYKYLSINSMNEANLLVQNNPFYTYKFGLTLKFFEEYEEAYYQFIKTLKIRPNYKDTKLQIEMLEELPPGEYTPN